MKGMTRQIISPVNSWAEPVFLKFGDNDSFCVSDDCLVLWE